MNERKPIFYDEERRRWRRTRRVLEIGIPVDVGIAVASKLVGKKHPGLAKGLALFSATGQAGAALPIRLAGCT